MGPVTVGVAKAIAASRAENASDVNAGLEALALALANAIDNIDFSLSNSMYSLSQLSNRLRQTLDQLQLSPERAPVADNSELDAFVRQISGPE